MIKLNDSGVIFNEEKHTYIYEGKVMSGITRAINRQYYPEMVDISELPEHVQNLIKEAGAYGTEVHKAIEDFIDGLPPMREEVLDFIEFCDNNGLKPIASEYLVTDRLNFASAIDIVCVDKDNNVYLVDTKTTKQYKKLYCEIQLSVYKYFFELINPHLKVKGAYVFQINRRKELIKKTRDVEFKAEAFVIDFLTKEVEYWKTGEVEEFKIPAKVNNLMNVLAEKQIAINQAKEEEKELRKTLEKAFKEFGVDKLENDYITISKREGYTRKSVDTKALEKDYPDIIEKYKKETEVKESIQIRLK